MPGEQLALVILDEEVMPTTEHPSGDDLAPGEYREDSRVGEWVRRVVLRREPVGLDALRAELEGVQAQVEKLLAGVADRQVGAMRLNGLQVSLGITAQGSIGVVTAGMQASLTLVYERGT